MAHQYQDLARDRQVAFEEKVAHGRDAALQRVLHRYDGMRALTPLQLLEHLLELVARDGVHLPFEIGIDRVLAEGAMDSLKATLCLISTRFMEESTCSALVVRPGPLVHGEVVCDQPAEIMFTLTFPGDGGEDPAAIPSRSPGPSTQQGDVVRNSILPITP
jgi:hypothetical protein